MGKRSTGTLQELAAVLGVARSTILNYASEADFVASVGKAKSGVERRYPIFDVVVWYVLNREKKQRRVDVHRQLSETLGVDEPAEEWTVKDEREQLELRIKETELERRQGELIKISDVEDCLRDFAASLNDALESVERTSSQPILPIVEPVFAQVMAELQKVSKQ